MAAERITGRLPKLFENVNRHISFNSTRIIIVKDVSKQSLLIRDQPGDHRGEETDNLLEIFNEQMYATNVEPKYLNFIEKMIYIVLV